MNWQEELLKHIRRLPSEEQKAVRARLAEALRQMEARRKATGNGAPAGGRSV